jgi:hypothetical protein
MKRCKKCGNDQEDSCFYAHKKAKDGLREVCKTCSSTESKSYQTLNKEKIRIRVASKKYGINAEWYYKTLSNQNNSCAGCNRAFVDVPHVDHDHTTGQVRGLLCGSCNRAIGLLQENTDTMIRLVGYLNQHQPIDALFMPIRSPGS